LLAAIPDGVAPQHQRRWAPATLEACGALLESARSGHDVALAHQVAVPARARD
jgi:hypothetical protein